jgi:hypothetical protein
MSKGAETLIAKPPLAKVALEAHALGDLEARDDTPLPRLRPGSIGIHAQMPSIGCPNVRFPPHFV